MRALELFRILLRHPAARITVATSRQDESPRLDAIHPSLARGGSTWPVPLSTPIVSPPPRKSPSWPCRTAASMAVAPALRKRGVRVIDLSADYRLKDAAVYCRLVRPRAYRTPEGLREAVYGLPELYRERIPAAGLIANPGCYTSASILGLAPLVAEGKIERTGIIIDAKSGVSGAGRSPKLSTHFPECNENFSAYGVGKHRHTPEIDQILTDTAGPPGGPVEVIFTPHLVPMDRGILATIYAVPTSMPVERDLMELYRAFYAASPFVRVVDHLPGTKDSAYTNFCDLTVRVVRGRIVVISCLDNLIKGASGVAVQNFNLMHGHPETTALL